MGKKPYKGKGQAPLHKAIVNAKNKKPKLPAWNSLKKVSQTYRHILRGMPFLLTNNSLGFGLGTSAGFHVIFNSLQGFARYQSIYDQYRIVKCKFNFFPLANVNDMSGLDSITNPARIRPLYYAVDLDDSTNPTLPFMFERANLKQINYGKSFSISWRPHVNVDVSSAGGLTKQSVASPWLDTAQTTTEHYGLKLFIEDLGVGTNDIYTITTEFYIEFKGTR